MNDITKSQWQTDWLWLSDELCDLLELLSATKNCRVLKRVGGQWHGKQVDGDKFVCFDSILRSQSCLVYSFGVSTDWSFEDQMGDLGMLLWEALVQGEDRSSGCRVFSYDHTIEAPAERGKNIKFFKTGLGFGENLEPFGEILKRNDHQATTIDYLKVREGL